jgi:hypothetical protein
VHDFNELNSFLSIFIFIPLISGSLKYNYFSERDSAVSLYGSCVPIVGTGQDSVLDYTNIACVWSEDDCPSTNNQYMIAGQYSGLVNGDTYDDLCTCDKVMTGACVDKSGKGSESDFAWFMCAVSSDSCDDESEFIPWQEVQTSGRDCRLCDTFHKSDDVPMGNLLPNVGGSGGTTPTDPQNQNVVSDNPDFFNKMNANNGSNRSHHPNTGKTIGVLVGGAVIGAILTILGSFCLKRCSGRSGKKTNKNVTKESASPTLTPPTKETFGEGDMEDASDFKKAGIMS